MAFVASVVGLALATSAVTLVGVAPPASAMVVSSSSVDLPPEPSGNPLTVRASVHTPVRELLEDYKGGKSRVAAIVNVGGKPQLKTWDVGSATEASNRLASAQHLPGVVAVGMDRRVGTPETPPTPSKAAVGERDFPPGPADLSGQQWGFSAVQASCVWRAAAEVVVAVIDGGVDATHPDLVGQVLQGKDYINPEGNGWLSTAGAFHGTAVASIIAANADGKGMNGIASSAKILPLRTQGIDGYGNDSDVAAAIIWATDHGADVTNISLGATYFSDVEKVAVDYAHSKNVAVVASAGNTGDATSGNSNAASYPAAYTDVLAVGAVNQNGAHLVFSQTGPQIDLVAPGTNILVALPQINGGGWGKGDGTSGAAPHVAGMVANLTGWLRSHGQPGATGLDGARRVVNTTRNTARDDVYGWGQPDGCNAVSGTVANHPDTYVSPGRTLPPPPLNVTASPAWVYPAGVTSGDGWRRSVEIAWDQPKNDWPDRIHHFEVTASPGGAKCSQTPNYYSANPLGIGTVHRRACIIHGLDFDTQYTFSVVTANLYSLPGEPQTYSPPVQTTPVTLHESSPTPPSAPSDVVAVAGAGHVRVSWRAPDNDGGAQITNYTATSSESGNTCSTAGALTCVVTGLTNGQAYTFTVTATNVVKTSLPSAPSAPVTPQALVPSVPGAAHVTGFPALGQATLAWTAPATDGGAAVSGYRVAVSAPNSATNFTAWTTAPTPGRTFTGLVPGATYRVRILAVNSIGNSQIATTVFRQASAPSPVRSARVAAWPAPRQARIAWLAPASNGGSPIVRYLVRVSAANSTNRYGAWMSQPANASPVRTITGLIKNATYRVQIIATNSQGNSALVTTTFRQAR